MLSKTLKHLTKGTLFKVLSNISLKKTRYSKPHNFMINAQTILRYGLSAPRVDEVIWFNPVECTMVLNPDYVKKWLDINNIREASAKVIESNWPVEYTFPIKMYHDHNIYVNNKSGALSKEERVNLKLKSCYEHWLLGIPWEQTGAFQLMERQIEEEGKWDGCNNMIDVVQRYENLDKIYNQIKKDGRFRLENEIESNHFWVGENLYIHIGPKGEPYMAGTGIHRFAIALMLNIRKVPAYLGCVHRNAIPILSEYRKC